MEPLDKDKFTIEEYRKKTSKFIEWAATKGPKEDLKGKSWFDLLCGHKWKGQDWKDGIRARNCFHTKLLEAIDNTQRLQCTVRDIVLWGQNNAYNVEPEKIQMSLKFLDKFTKDTRYDDWEKNLVSKRIATTSKIYAMWNPCEWTIYDSRVGNALAFLVKTYYGNDIKKCELDDYLFFPIPPSRAHNFSYVKGFRKLGNISNTTKKEKEARLAFIYSSWLLQEIAKQVRELEEPPPDPQIKSPEINVKSWQVYHIEMALFMYGQ